MARRACSDRRTWKAPTPRSIRTRARTRRDAKFFKQFSFPGHIGSHVTPETPGSIHEGGELGYSLSHAYGMALDNPDLIVACVVGDGEAETGPLATAWHSNKFINPVRDGAVLPILNLNGYKIANPTILARISHEELEALFVGYGYTPYFVEGSDPAEMHQKMAATLNARSPRFMRSAGAWHTNEPARPRWPMIVLRSPKGWTGPKEVKGHQMSASLHSAEVAAARPSASRTPLVRADRVADHHQAGRTVLEELVGALAARPERVVERHDAEVGPGELGGESAGRPGHAIHDAVEGTERGGSGRDHGEAQAALAMRREQRVRTVEQVALGAGRAEPDRTRRLAELVRVLRRVGEVVDAARDDVDPVGIRRGPLGEQIVPGDDDIRGLHRGPPGLPLRPQSLGARVGRVHERVVEVVHAAPGCSEQLAFDRAVAERRRLPREEHRLPCDRAGEATRPASARASRTGCRSSAPGEFDEAPV